jgi:hypothetical protein
MEIQSGRKPQNVFSYMSLRITFIGRTNFLSFPTATGRRLQPPSFSGYNLREAPTPQFTGYNQKEATTTRRRINVDSLSLSLNQPLPP